MSKLLEEILSDENVELALEKVKAKKGKSGIDGITVKEIDAYMRENWTTIRDKIRRRRYTPKPVRRVEIPKPDGGIRKLGIPTVADRVIEQAIAQVLTPIVEPYFSEYSYGFRPKRRAQQAILKLLEYFNDGYTYIVDIDLEKFFDQVPQDRLMSLVHKFINDPDTESLIRKYLNAGVMIEDQYEETLTGTPQGGNLSPLLSNIMLNELDKELEARGMTDSVNRARIHLAVGLPLKWVQAQRDIFRDYMMKERIVKVGYKDRIYEMEFTGCTVMPQCYSAVAENLKDFKGMNLLVDIGSGTMTLMYLNNGRPMESKSWTEKLGVYQCEKAILNKVRDNTGTELMHEVIENFLRTGETDIAQPYAGLMVEAAKEYAVQIFQKLRDYEYNEQMMRLYVMGGGARIVEAFGEYDMDRVTFDHDIRANAKGYEYYCYMLLRHQERAGRR